MTMLSRMRAALPVLKPAEFALTGARCPFCGPSLIVRLRRDFIGVRCMRCAASAAHMALGWTLHDAVTDLGACDVCELSARGPLAAYLRRRAKSAATSEYFAGVAPGTNHLGVRCEDVQRLTYADASFDVVTHTEVLEHVPDDALAFTELARVLRPGGTMVFTVPMYDGAATIERARLRDGVIEHLLEPICHTDPLRGEGILAFRDYGRDILGRLLAAGFAEAELVDSAGRVPWIADCPVILARKNA